MEGNIKRLYVIYFRRNGSTYRVEEEYVPIYLSYTDMVKEMINRMSYTDMDMVILDGEDGLIPYFKPYLYKKDNLFTKSKGF